MLQCIAATRVTNAIQSSHELVHELTHARTQVPAKCNIGDASHKRDTITSSTEKSRTRTYTFAGARKGAISAMQTTKSIHSSHLEKDHELTHELTRERTQVPEKGYIGDASHDIDIIKSCQQ